VLQAPQFMSIKQSILYYNIFIYNTLINTLSVALRNRIEIVKSDSEKQTRQAGNIVLGFQKTRSASMLCEGVKMYDSLPAMIKQCDRIELMCHNFFT